MCSSLCCDVSLTQGRGRTAGQRVTHRGQRLRVAAAGRRGQEQTGRWPYRINGEFPYQSEDRRNHSTGQATSAAATLIRIKQVSRGAAVKPISGVENTNIL